MKTEDKKENSIEETYTIQSLSDYMKVFESRLTEKYSNSAIRLYFRGEQELYPKPCVPSLFRRATKEFKTLTEDEIYYRTLRRMPNEFKGLSNLDIISKMQHYGIPTRLLDITTNPLVALFFAIQGSLSKDGSVYIFDANHESKESILSYDSDKALLIATLPKLNDNQKAYIKEYCRLYPDIRITPEVISEGTNSDSPIKDNPNMIKALGKFIYECERERHAFHLNHKVLPTDLLKIYYAKPQFTNERLQAQDGLFILFGLGQERIHSGVSCIKIPSKFKKIIQADLFFFAGLSNFKIYKGLDSLSGDKKDELFSVLKKYNENQSKNQKVLKQQALTCSEYAVLKGELDNKVLATTGDALLSFLFLDYLRENNVASSMEELSNWKEIIQDNRILNIIGKHLFKSHKLKAFNNDLNGNKSYATILEAYIYAVYLTEGLESAKTYISNYIIETLKYHQVKDMIIDVFSNKTAEPASGKNWTKLKDDYLTFITK